MSRNRRALHQRMVAAAAIGASATGCLGQASFAEDFDALGALVSGQPGPQALVSRGWAFRNQSSPLGGSYYTWIAGPYTYWLGYVPFQPQAGAGYLGADTRSTDRFSGGVISDWAILPPVPAQAAGDVITLWARSLNGLASERLEVRYSPTGATATGSTTEDVGDFTQALLSVSPVPAGGWAQLAAPVPGSGRLAIRWYVNRAQGNGGLQSIVGIDSLRVGAPAPPCPAFPPVPAPGQTVAWGLGGSPYRMCADVVIPAGATVLVDPGVRVAIDAGRSLVVEGTLRCPGTASAPITLDGADGSARLKVVGTFEASHAVINCRVQPQDGGGATLLADCTLRCDQEGALDVFGLPTYLWTNPPLVRLDRCRVLGDGVPGHDFMIGAAHAALRDVTFDRINPSIGGYVLVDRITSTNSPAAGLSVGMPQGVHLDRITVTGAADAGLALSGDCFIGAGCVIQSNLLPIQAGGGVRRGSAVPTGGNAMNHIRTLLYDPGSIMPDFGLPYVFTSNSGCVSTWPNIDPGVTIALGPAALICSEGGRVLVRGLPNAPITLRALDPARPWNKLLVGGIRGSRLERCAIEGAGVGVGAQAGAVTLIDSTIHGNDTGAAAIEGPSGSGIVQAFKTRFLDNRSVGVRADLESTAQLHSPALPNAFERNAIGILAMDTTGVDARRCWWGDATGPSHPDNPAGRGDSISGPGALWVPFAPFRTAPPDADDHPPVVRIAHQDYIPDSVAHGLFEAGSKVVIEWSADDDDEIVEQRILFSPTFNLYDSLFQHVATLPPSQRRFEWTVPDIGFNHQTPWSYFRVVAVDRSGQPGWDEIRMTIPSADITARISITSDFGGRTFRAGQRLPPITWSSDAPFFGTPTFYIMLDGDEKSVYLGGGGSGTWPLTDSPYVSTDTARIAVVLQSTYNIQKWTFGNYFALRPDPRIGDSAPGVRVTAPAAGQSFPAGSYLPIAWTADDDEGVRSFNVQASFDGGRTWHVVARDLPGSATGYDWPLPPGAGVADLRLRVVAFDRRFQNSSSTVGPVTITPGDSACPGITAHPLSVTACPGGSAALAVAAGGGTPLTYRWQVADQSVPGVWVTLADGEVAVGGVAVGTVAGAATPRLVFQPASALDQPVRFRCVAVNPCGDAPSSPATVTPCRVDWNCDGTIDFNDFLDYLNLYNAGNPLADLNGDYIVDFNDFLEFINLYNTGC